MPQVLKALATEQDLVVTRAQLAEAGIGHDGVASRTAQGIWRDLGPHVVALHTGELTVRQRWWTGVLHAGPDSALALASAATANGLRGYSEWTVHVAVEHGSEVQDLIHPQVAVRVHQTRHPRTDLVTGRTPARQTLARAAVEMASAARSDDRCRAILAAVVQQRLVLPTDLGAFVATRPTLPRRRLIRETISDVVGGAHSLPELDYARALRRAGLPQPARQQVVQRDDGVWYLDNDFEPWLVSVEINGMQHTELLASEADDERRSWLQVRGRLVVDISSYSVRHRERIAVLRTAEALLSRGWRPDSRTTEVLRDYCRKERRADLDALLAA